MPSIRPSIAIAALGTTAFVLFVVFSPVYTHGWDSKGRAIRTACLSNIKQIGYAHLLYTEDHNGRFAPIEWVPVIKPRLKEDRVLQCPIAVKQDGSGYAYNRLLASVKDTDVDQPENTALHFEVDDLRLGATADRLSPLATKRHDETLALAFTDGHAKRVRFDRLKSVKLRPQAVPIPKSSNKL